MIKVIPIGSSVKIGPDGKTIGTVTSINLRGPNYNIQYEVQWWDADDIKSKWMESYMVTQTKGLPVEIGY